MVSSLVSIHKIQSITTIVLEKRVTKADIIGVHFQNTKIQSTKTLPLFNWRVELHRG